MSLVRNIEENDCLEISKRIEIDDIKGLQLEKRSNIKDIGVYGIKYHLKRFAGIDPNIVLNKCTIEHGLGLMKYVCQMEVQHHVSRILTYSPYREDVIRELTEFTPIAIGPYIAYAEDYRTKAVTQEKKNMLGRTLLVMPAHSMIGMEATYSLELFFREIELVKTKFDTVLVCLYIEDLKRGLWKPYKEKGFGVVSAGQTYSPHFFSRLKYILSLSDALLLNEYSTGMSYAMYMGRPIHLVRGDIEYNTTIRNNGFELEEIKNDAEVYKLFDNEQFMITDEQIRFGEYMFGLKSVKSKEEMKSLLLSLARTTG